MVIFSQFLQIIPIRFSLSEGSYLKMHNLADYCTLMDITCGSKKISLEKPVVMGILNVTPDSFYDGGFYPEPEGQLKRIEEMTGEGASIIDIGALSTRPGSRPAPESTELERLGRILPEAVSRFPETVFSVDTYRSQVAVFAAESGAGIVNDISAGGFDDNMFKTISNLQVAYIMMHILGTPETMQKDPQYPDVVGEIREYFRERLQKLGEYGKTENIILDPGFGFGKTPDHNFALLARLGEFEELGCPVMAGLSRKSMINKVLGTVPEKALNGTTVLNTIALLNGARILRVHDVKEAVEAIRLVEKYLENRD